MGDSSGHSSHCAECKSFDSDFLTSNVQGDNKLLGILRSDQRNSTPLRSIMAADINDELQADEHAQDLGGKRPKVTPETILRSFYDARLADMEE
jgi:hypothetical protein